MKKHVEIFKILTILIFGVFFIGCGDTNEKNKVCNGTGTIQYSNGTYIGECKNGQKEGKGVFTWDNGSKYDGEWKNGQEEGKGVFTWDDGSKYDGEWKNGQKEGKGVLIYSSGGKYDGEWKNGQEEGKGVFTWDDGSKYDGEWKNGKREGKGVLIYSSGSKYDGEWKNGQEEGKGVFTWDDGSKYDGEWKNGQKEGKGVLIYSSGGKYDGEWKNGQEEGKGVFTWDDGSKYDGEWKNGQKEGKGVLIYSSGGKYDGEWKNGKREGKGKTINQEGICKGNWEENKLTEITNQNSYEEAYSYFNNIRKQAGMIALVPNGILQEAAQSHSDYAQIHYERLKNDPYINDKGLTGHNEEINMEGFTGVSPANRAIAQGWLSYYGVSEGISGRCTAKVSINNLMTAIYHRFGILSFTSNTIGIGFTQENDSLVRKFVHNSANSNLNDLCEYDSYSSGSAYPNICINSQYKIEVDDYQTAIDNIKKLNPQYVLWPADKSIDNLYLFEGETPDPMPDYNQTGNPISIQFNDFYFSEKITMKSFKLFKDGNEIKETRILTEETDPNKHFNNYQYALFPLKILDKDTTYKVSFKYIYNGVSKEINWLFRTMK